MNQKQWWLTMKGQMLPILETQKLLFCWLALLYRHEELQLVLVEREAAAEIRPHDLGDVNSTPRRKVCLRASANSSTKWKWLLLSLILKKICVFHIKKNWCQILKSKKTQIKQLLCFSIKILGRNLDYYHVLHYYSHILDAASWFPPKGSHTIISTLRQHGAQCLNQQLISGRDKKESSKEKKQVWK